MESADGSKQVVGGLLMKANKYRSFVRLIGDWETAQRLLALAEEERSSPRLGDLTSGKFESAPLKSGRKMAARLGLDHAQTRITDWADAGQMPQVRTRPQSVGRRPDEFRQRRPAKQRS
jgi:hypothetical protein